MPKITQLVNDRAEIRTQAVLAPEVFLFITQTAALISTNCNGSPTQPQIRAKTMGRRVRHSLQAEHLRRCPKLSHQDIYDILIQFSKYQN